MKRFIIGIMSLAICLLTASCGKAKTEAVNMDFSYKCEAEIKYHDRSSVAEFERIKNGEWKIIFKSPETIEGMTIEYNSKGYKFEYNSLSFESLSADYPDSSAVKLITGILDSLADSRNKECIKDGSTVSESGIFDGGDFDATFDSGVIRSVEFPGENMSAEFRNFERT